MSRRHLWGLVVGAGLLACSCSQSYSDIKSIRCPTDLLCPGGLICLNGYCVNQHGLRGGGLSGFGSTGVGMSGSTGGGTCLSCPEMFLQGSANGCSDSSAELFNKLKTTVCNSSVCDTSATCQSNLCNSGFTLPSSGGIGGIGGGGMTPQCEACAADIDPGDFNKCAFDPVNGRGTTGTVTTGGTMGFSGSTGSGTGTGGCLGPGKACNGANALCCSPYECNSGQCGQFSMSSTTGSTGISTSGSSGGGSCSEVVPTSNCASVDPNCGDSTTRCSLEGQTWSCYEQTICGATTINTCECADGGVTLTCATGVACSSTQPCGGSNPLYNCRFHSETNPSCTEPLSEVAGTCYCTNGRAIPFGCAQMTTCQALCSG